MPCRDFGFPPVPVVILPIAETVDFFEVRDLIGEFHAEPAAEDESEIDRNVPEPEFVTQKVAQTRKNVFFQKIARIAALLLRVSEKTEIDADVILFGLSRVVHEPHQFVDFDRPDSPQPDMERLGAEFFPEPVHVEVARHRRTDQKGVVSVVFDQAAADEPFLQDVRVILHPELKKGSTKYAAAARRRIAVVSIEKNERIHFRGVFIGLSSEIKIDEK